MTAAYNAFHKSAALLDLTGRGHIRLTGEDRARLLHAMTTNHIQQLQPGQWCYTFFLNAQGRMLADANIICRDDALFLDCEPGSREFLLDHLDKFIIADDVELADLTAETAVLSLEGPHALDIAARAELGLSWPISATGAPACRFFLPFAQRADAIAKLQSAGAVPADEADAEALRLEHAKPRYGSDLTADHIPHEARLAGAVHFNKGCYLGQEIVERVRSRGRPNRLLTLLEVEGAEPLPAGSKLIAADKEAGEVTSSAFSPNEGATLAFAYLRTEFTAPGTALSVADRRATATGRLVETPAA